jgi:hypothetical protein
VNRIVRGGVTLLAVSAIALSLGAKGGCGGPPPGEKGNRPGQGPHYKCGYTLNGSGTAEVTFDIQGDDKPSQTFTVGVPHSAKNSYTCTSGAKMDLRADVPGNHALQCKLYQKGEQSNEDHAGLAIGRIRAVDNPSVHCQYP